MDLFREKGFEPTTMRDIAAKAGVALGGAYYYFSSKDAIVLAFYSEMQASSNEPSPEALCRPQETQGADSLHPRKATRFAGTESQVLRGAVPSCAGQR